jgi:hypothetical protein
MSPRQIYMSMKVTETPADLRDGERVEAIRLAGPRDGDRIGVFVARLLADGSVELVLEGEELPPRCH